MELALDTSAYTALLAGEAKVRDQLRMAKSILIPSIVLGELYYGFFKGKKSYENLTYLATFMRDNRVKAGNIDENVARAYGEIQVKLREKGVPIPSNDMWIAATCIEQGYTLIARDAHFEKIDGLNLISF